MATYTVFHELLGVSTELFTIEADTILIARDIAHDRFHDPDQNVYVGKVNAKESSTIAVLEWEPHYFYVVDVKKLKAQLAYIQAVSALAPKP